MFLPHAAGASDTSADSPYNYIVDPGVRDIMGINLKDAVVIFDEVHVPTWSFLSSHSKTRIHSTLATKTQVYDAPAE